MADREHITVILGAGASHDIWSGRTPRLSADKMEYIDDGEHHPTPWKPPLAKDLFAWGKFTEFARVASDFRGIENIATSIDIDTNANPAVSLEVELRRYANHPNERLREQFKLVPGYLQALIWRASHEYVPSDFPTGLDILAHTLLEDTDHAATFLTMNYDTYLEQALSRIYGFSPKTMDDYIETPGPFTIAKLHGSIDWFYPFGSSHDTWHDAVKTFDIESVVGMDPIRPQTARRAHRMSEAGRRWYPALTAPLAGKGPEANTIVCPERHMAAAAQGLQRCRRMLIVGCSGLDDDLLHFLEQHTPTTSPLNVEFVGHADARDAVKRFARGVTAIAQAGEGGNIRIWHNGFQHWLGHGRRTFAGLPTKGALRSAR